MAELVNPIVEYSAPFLAERALKFPTLYPTIFGSTTEKILVINNEILDLHLSNGLVYRMARGTEDISGVYQSFPDVSECKVGPYTVTMKGCYGKVFVATWTDGKFTFSFHTPYGIGAEEIEKMVGSLRPVNGMAAPCPIVEYEYRFQAEYAVNFSIKIPGIIHDKAEKKRYFVISGKVAEIVYNDDLVYRMAKGVLDISGVFQKFDTQEEFQVGNYHVLAKGNTDRYYVTLWNDGKYSFSLHAPHGVNRKEIEQFIRTLGVAN